MKKSTKQDLAVLKELQELMKQHNTAEQVDHILWQRYERLPMRLAGREYQSIRHALNSQSGLEARRQDPQLQRFYDALYEKMVHPHYLEQQKRAFASLKAVQ